MNEWPIHVYVFRLFLFFTALIHKHLFTFFYKDNRSLFYFVAVFTKVLCVFLFSPYYLDTWIARWLPSWRIKILRVIRWRSVYEVYEVKAWFVNSGPAVVGDLSLTSISKTTPSLLRRRRGQYATSPFFLLSCTPRGTTPSACLEMCDRIETAAK